MEKAYNIYSAMRENVKKVIFGKDEIIDLTLAALFCGGHILLDDVPGTGKTRLAKALASSINCSFNRVQFTPDLLPADLTGINYFNMKTASFEFIKGPVFSNIILADEINRATPKTQSGLLECMEERQATVDGVTYRLSSPFMVIATQNPIDNMGTFPLPEAQLDRFLIKTSMGYPSHSEAVRVISSNAAEPQPVSAVASADDVRHVMSVIENISVHPDIINYIATIIEVTRKHSEVILGASPRSGIHLLKVAKGFAFMEKRSYVLPDDVKKAAIPVLAHRLILTNSARVKKGEDSKIISEILEAVPVPTEPVFENGNYR